MNNTGAIVLAAGKGTRMKSTTVNKVMLDLNGKPMIAYTVDHLKKAGFCQIILVTGFAKKSVETYFDTNVCFAYQRRQLGTAHALMCGLAILPPQITDVLVMYGDDSYAYSPKLFMHMYEKHKKTNAAVTVLTLTLPNSYGLGRILRNENGDIVGIVEEKVATDEQKKIHEINTGCYFFKREFLNHYIRKIKKNPVVNEYFLTDIVEIGLSHHETIVSITEPNIYWRGINRPEELEEARRTFGIHQ